MELPYEVEFESKSKSDFHKVEKVTAESPAKAGDFKVGDKVKIIKCCYGGCSCTYTGQEGIVSKIDLSNDEPYNVKLGVGGEGSNGMTYTELELIKKGTEIKSTKQEAVKAPLTPKKVMSTIVKKIKNLTKSKSRKLLEKHGLVDENGNFTDQYDEVLMDKLREEKRETILEDLGKVEAEEKKEDKA